jgi:hypothetical protein
MTQISRARRLPSSRRHVDRPYRVVPAAATRLPRRTSRAKNPRIDLGWHVPRQSVWHDSATDTKRLPIRLGHLAPLFRLLGITHGLSYVDVAPDRVRVRMGWAFGAKVPRTSIRSARRVRDAISIGVHGWGGRWLVNGAAGPLVSVTIDPPASARVLGFPVRLRELIVSVDDPGALIGELGPVHAGAA